MENFTYKGISDGKYVEGDIEALNLDEASHKLKEQKVIITNLIRGKKKKTEKTGEKKKGFSLSFLGKSKNGLYGDVIEEIDPVSYTHLTLPTNREV